MSIFDDIDRRFRHPKKPEISLDPLEAGQHCPNPHCRGKLAWHSLTDEPHTGGRYLACDDPSCGWTEKDGRS